MLSENEGRVALQAKEQVQKMVRPGFEFKAGFRLEAQDFSEKW